MVGSALLVGCSQATEDVTEQTTSSTDEASKDKVETETETVEKVKDQPMQYITDKDLKDSIDASSDEYVILDVRKLEDYEKGHIEGAYTADQDAANKGGDDEKGKENLRIALKEATGNETGSADKKYVLVCYSGKSYAQKGTDLMVEMGIPAENIYTLEGGMKAWEANGEEYKNLVK